jgi:CspA family cold shock protein
MMPSSGAALESRPLQSDTQFERAFMAEGTIKKLTDKGFGFIKVGGTKDLFFHSKNLQGVTFDELQEGQKVSFTEGSGPKGPCAENVRVI